MNEDEQRIALAEFCGFEFHGADCDGKKETKRFRRKQNFGQWVTCDFEQLPDFLNDLNATAEAEEVLMKQPDYQLCNKYSGLVDDIVCRDTPCDDAIGIEFLHATARQRAEALLKTIGKWKD